jgi:hypothetical protein
MTIFTVYVPNSAETAGYGHAAVPVADNPAFARAVFLPEHFSWSAFIFGPLWLLSCGLWLAFLVWLVLAIALVIVGGGLLTVGAAFWIFVATEFFLGVEGNNLRRSKLERRGYRGVEVVAGRSRDEAEKAFFSRWMESSDPPAAPPSNRVAPAADLHSEVLGHFPLPGGRE